jgi:hypothetical protein
MMGYYIGKPKIMWRRLSVKDLRGLKGKKAMIVGWIAHILAKASVLGGTLPVDEAYLALARCAGFCPHVNTILTSPLALPLSSGSNDTLTVTTCPQTRFTFVL